MEKAEESFSQKNYQDRHLYITRGGLDHKYNQDNVTALAIDELIELIKKKNLTGFRWKYKVYEEFGHVPEPSYVDGLNWFFAK